MKVGVIGGSLGGLEFAKRLAELDGSHEIEVFEEDDEIGLPVKCAEGWLTVHGTGSPHPDAVENEVESVRLRFRDVPEEHRDVALEVKGDAYVIDRARNERMLAEEARELGVSVHTGERRSVAGLAEEHDLVVDASGCPPQHWRESEEPEGDWSGGVQLRVEGDFSRFSDEMLLEFVPEVVGYYWIFPKSGTEANVGLGWSRETRPEDPWGDLESFLGRYLEEYEVVSRTAGRIGTEIDEPLYDPERGLAKVGDAAGLADPANGEGMSAAVVSARLLAEAVHEEDLDGYGDRVMEALGSQLEHSRLLRRVWEEVEFDRFAALFNLLDGFYIEDFFENPERIRNELLKHPSVSVKLLSSAATGRLKKLLG